MPELSATSMQCVALNLRIVTHLQKGCGCVGWKMIFDLVLDEASPSHCQYMSTIFLRKKKNGSYRLIFTSYRAQCIKKLSQN